MRPELRILAKYRMERAKESFEEGSTLLETGGLTGAVNPSTMQGSMRQGRSWHSSKWTRPNTAE
mgnify:CR=1 FL=1